MSKRLKDGKRKKFDEAIDLITDKETSYDAFRERQREMCRRISMILVVSFQIAHPE